MCCRSLCFNMIKNFWITISPLFIFLLFIASVYTRGFTTIQPPPPPFNHEVVPEDLNETDYPKYNDTKAPSESKFIPIECAKKLECKSLHTTTYNVMLCGKNGTHVSWYEKTTNNTCRLKTKKIILEQLYRIAEILQKCLSGYPMCKVEKLNMTEVFHLQPSCFYELCDPKIDMCICFNDKHVFANFSIGSLKLSTDDAKVFFSILNFN